MQRGAINLEEKLGLFTEQWAPKVIAEMNDYQFKVVRIEGDFIWHDHQDTDETFIVIEGDLRIDFRDGSVNLSRGEMFVVPRGSNTSHSPRTRSSFSSSSPAEFRTQATKAASGRRRTMY